MRKLLVLMLAISFAIIACDPEPVEPTSTFSYSLSTNTADTTGLDTDIEINPSVQVTNTSENEINLKWVRQNENLSIGWGIAVCDDAACHDPSVTERVMTLDAGESFKFKMTFRPNSSVGTSSAEVIFFNPEDSVNTAELVTFTATASK